MNLAELAFQAVSFLVGSLADGKGVKTAKDDFTTALWNWIGPIFVKDDTPLNDLKEDRNNPLNQSEIALKVEKYLRKNPSEVQILKKVLTNLEDSNSNQGNLKITQNHFGSGDNVARDKNIK